jgi:hypothetical protein
MTRILRRCARWTCVLLILSVVLAAAGWVGLRVFSPRLALLYPAIRDAVERAAPGWEIEFDAVSIDWVNRWFVPGVEATNVRIGRRDEKPALTLPRMLLVFDLADLLRGRISPAGLEADEPRLVLDRIGPVAPDAETAREFEPAPAIRDVLRRAADALSIDLPLRKFRIRDFEILLGPDDPSPLRIARIHGDLERTSEAVSAEFSLRIDGETDPGRIVFAAKMPRSEGVPAEATLSLEALIPDRLAGLHPRLKPLAGLDLPIDGTVRAALSPDGRFAVPEIRLAARGGRIVRPDLWKYPLEPREIVLEAALSDGAEGLEVRRAVLDFGGPIFEVSGRVGPFPRPRDWKVEGRMDGFSIDEIDRYWPVGLIPHTRDWLADRMGEGTVDGATFAVRLRPGDFGDAPLPREAISAEVPFVGLRLVYLADMEPIREIAGTARFSARDIEFDVTGGRHYGADVTAGAVRIAPLSAEETPRIEIAATADGPADALPRALADLFGWSEPPFAFEAGRAETRLAFDFPLDDFEPEEFRWSAESRGRDLSIPDLAQFAVRLERCAVRVTESGEFSLEGDGGTVARENYFRTPLDVGSIRGTGRLPRDGGAIPIAVRAEVEGTNLEIDGNISPTAGPANLDLNIRLDRTDLETALRHWPEPLAPEVRRWIGEHLTGGTISEARVRIDLETGQRDRDRLPLTSVEAMVPFEDVRLSGLLSLPPLESLAGTAQFTARKLIVEVAGGVVSETAVDSGTVRVSGLDGGAPSILRVEAALTGPAGDLRTLARDMMEMTDAEIPPLEPADTPTRTGIVLELPLDPEGAGEAPRLEVRTEPSSPLHLGAVPLSEVQATIRFGPDGPEIGGHVSSRGLRVEMAPVPASELGRGGVRLTADLSETDFSRMGLPNAIRIAGNAPTSLVLRPGRDTLEFRLETDLKPAALEVPAVGWEKARGVPGTLEMQAVFERSTRIFRFSEIRLAGTGFRVAGSGDFAPDGGEANLRLDPLNLDPHRLTLDLSRKPKEFRIRLDGASLDLNPILERFRNPTQGDPGGRTGTSDEPESAAEPPRAFVLELDLDRVRLANGRELRNLNGEIRRDDAGAFRADLKATQDGNGRFVLSLAKTGALSLEAENAEALLRGLEIGENVRGGSLELNAALSAEFLRSLGSGGKRTGPIDGRVVLRRPTILGAPWLVRLLSAASLVGLLNELRDGGMGFSVVESGFQYDGNVLAIIDGRAEGFAMGLTVAGTVDPGRDSADLEGMVIPFNVVNKFIGAIPFLGRIVGDGIIATDYRLTGSLDDPDVQIRPLSTLPIGAIRDVFRSIDFQPPEHSPGSSAGTPGTSPK